MQTRLCLFCQSKPVSLCSLTTLIGTTVRIASDNISLVFLKSNGIVKMFFKIIGKKNKHRKIISLARSKLNITEKIISKALIDSDVSHDEFTLVINKEQH